MARAATTSDVFNAIAEQQRREILVLLRAGEGPVTELAQELGMTQPGASKHLRVLREVGLVRDRKAGKQRLYRLDARANSVTGRSPARSSIRISRRCGSAIALKTSDVVAARAMGAIICRYRHASRWPR